MKLTKALTAIAVIGLLFLSCQKEIQLNPPLQSTPPPPPPPVLNQPIIISFAPDSVQVGEEVMIKGKFFDPLLANNQLSVNDTAGTVLQTNDSTIRFKVNTGSTTGKVTVVTGGQAVVSTADLRIYVIPWVKKANYPELLSVGFGINGLVMSFNSATAGYIYKSNKLWQYDPAVNSWTRKADMPSARAHNFATALT